MSEHVNGSSPNNTSPDQPSSERPSSEESSSEEPSSLRSTPEQEPHPADRLHRFYPGTNNKYGGILPVSNLVVWDPETRFSHLQYLARLSATTTSFITDKTTMVVTIQHELQNDDTGEPRRYWDIYFGPDCSFNRHLSLPVDTKLTDTYGDIQALVDVLSTIELYRLGEPLLSQIYIVTDSETLVNLFTGPPRDREGSPGSAMDESHVDEWEIVDVANKKIDGFRWLGTEGIGINLWIVARDTLHKLTTSAILSTNPPSIPNVIPL